MKDELKKLSMDSIADGGEIALSGFIENMGELKEKIGDKNLTVSQFIGLTQQFKDVWVKSIKNKVN